MSFGCCRLFFSRFIKLDVGYGSLSAERRSPGFVPPRLFLLCGERKSVCSFLFLKNDSHGFTSGVIELFPERGETSSIRLFFEHFVVTLARFHQGGWRGRARAGRQLRPGRRSFEDVESDQVLRGNSEAHVLCVSFRLRGNADDFPALVEDRTATISRRDGTRQLVL